MFALSLVFTLILLTVCPPVAVVTMAVAVKAKARRK